MKSVISSIGVLGVVAALVLVGMYANAQDKPAAMPSNEMADNRCPACMMMMMDHDEMAETGTMPADSMGMMGRMRERMQQMMAQAGIPKETIVHNRAMANAPLYMDDPAVLIAQQKTLDLTPAQMTSLTDIQKETRAKAQAVLTAQQKSILGQVPDKPMSVHEAMMDLHKKMQQAGESKGMCPMMTKEKETTTMPAGEKMEMPPMKDTMDK